MIEKATGYKKVAFENIKYIAYMNEEKLAASGRITAI